MNSNNTKQISKRFSAIDGMIHEEGLEIVMLLEQPSGEILQRVREQLNENVMTLDNDLAYIKEWLRQEPHLPDDFDDQHTLTFLRSCKYSLEKFKRKLDMYFTVRSAVPTFFADRVLTRAQIREVTDAAKIIPLPGITCEGYRVFLFGHINDKLLSLDATKFCKLCFMINDARLRTERAAGDIQIVDMAGVKPRHLLKFTLPLLKKCFVCIQEAYPIRVRALHFVNVTALAEKFVDTLKPFLKEKLRNRIFLHSDIKSLFEHVPQEMLPQEYGGTVGSIADLQDKWVEELVEMKDWFAEQENIKADESRRVDKSTNYDEIFGIHGSFRQLVID